MEPHPKRLRSSLSPDPPPLALPPPPPDPPWPVILHNDQWISGVPIYANDEELARRLLAAASDQPFSVAQNESPRLSLRRLLDHGITVDCCTSGLAYYIAQTILNDQERPSSNAFRLVLGPEETITIHSRSRLTLWSLARSLSITIVLLSTRRRPHIFASEHPRATIGYLERIDSYHGTSQLLVLGKTRSLPVTRMLVDTPPAFPFSHDAATLKGQQGADKTKLAFEVNKDQYTQGIKEACIEVLREIAKNRACDVVKCTKLLPGQSETEFRTTELEAFRTSEQSRTRLPRGVVPKAAAYLKSKLSLPDTFTSETLHRIHGKTGGNNNIAIWQEVVETMCDEIWDASILQAEKDRDAKLKKKVKPNKLSQSITPSTREPEETDYVLDQETDKEKEAIRTCTVTLKSVLRPELVPQMNDIVIAMEDKQMQVTDDMAELAVLAHKVVLRIAAGDAFGSSEADNVLDAMDLLPSGFASRCEMSSKISVAPIPEGFQASIELALDKKTNNKDLLDAAGLLSQDFLQFLHTRFLGPRGTSAESKAKHPLWELIAVAIDDPSNMETVKLQGLSSTITEAIREFTTAVNNIWEGAIYKKSLDYLLRILLRLHLAPLRELKTKETKHKKAQEKQDAIEKKKVIDVASPPSKTQRKQWQSKTISLFNQLSDVLESATDEVARRRVPILLSLLQAQQRLKPRPGEQTRLSSIEESLKSAAESQDKQVAQPVFMDPEQATQTCLTPSLESNEQAAAEDVGYDSDEDDRDSVFGGEAGATVLESKAAIARKEPTRARLKALQTVLMILLETDTKNELVDRAWVRKKAFRGSNLEDAECDVVLKLGKLLGPYVPKRRPATEGHKTRAAIAHVALRAPLALIANTVLRITGYAEFTRRLAPQISAGARHALAIGAVGIYEVLCGGSGAFVVKDRHGNAVTNRQQITADPENKNAVFGAFFDTSKIDKICKDHGLQFRQRIVYVNRRTVHIVGRVIPQGGRRQGHPVESRLERRKRERRSQPSSNNKWMQALAVLDMSKKAVGEKAEEAKNVKEELERQTKAPRSQMRSLRASQTLARREVNGNRTPETYDALQDARKTVRAARKLLRPKEQELRRARKNLYFWNKLEKLDMSSQDAAKNITSSTAVSMTTPTWQCNTVEDDVEHMNLDEIQRGCDGEKRAIVYAGTDYGVCKMSETVPLTQTRLKEHLQLFKNSDPSSQPPAQCSHLPISNKITAQQVNDISHSRKMGKRREARLKSNEEVKTAYERISRKGNSLTTAVTLAEVSAAHAARREARKIIQPFEASEKRQKDLHTQRLRSERAWTKLGAAERRHVVDAARVENGDHGVSASVSARDGWCSDCHRHHLANRPESEVFKHVSECPKKATEILPIMVIGDAGTGVGSRIGGHVRRGGKRMRVEHMKHGPVIIADEYNTSRTCCWCFEPTELATGRRIVKGQAKMVKVHGSVECVNEECVSFKAGYTMKSRDPHAAFAIALSGTSGLTSASRQVLTPFARGAVAST